MGLDRVRVAERRSAGAGGPSRRRGDGLHARLRAPARDVPAGLSSGDAGAIARDRPGRYRARPHDERRAVSESTELPALWLKRGEDARLRAGHLWVFSNEIDVARSPLSGFAPGDACAIVDHHGKPIGVGYVNPNSLIAARLVARGLDHALDRSLLVHRLNVALALRERLYAQPY